MKTMYHVSPENGLTRLRPGSGRHAYAYVNVDEKRGGVFLAPNKRDAILWAADVIAWRRQEGGGKSSPYTRLTIYKVEVPHDCVHTAVDTMWGREVFVPAQHLSQIRIVGRKTYDIRVIFRMATRIFRDSVPFEIPLDL